MQVSSRRLGLAFLVTVLSLASLARGSKFEKNGNENEAVPKEEVKVKVNPLKSDKDICQGKPADVVFVLDGSDSIWFRHFDTQLHFVQDVIDIFDISPQMTQIGAISFGIWSLPEFQLNTFRTKAEVRKRVGRIRQLHGDTNTASALRYLRKSSFRSEQGARAGVPHIGIVLTDGKSNKPQETAREAQLAREAGIHIFAVGVGNAVDEAELRAIATPGFHYHVDSFDALASIKDVLAISTCKVPEPTTTEAPSTEPPTESPILACGKASLADVVFAVSPQASALDTELALDFYRRVAANLTLDDDRVRVGLVPKDCGEVGEIALGDGGDTEALLERLDELDTPTPTTSATLRYMRRVSFHTRHGGARDQARKLGVVIVDGPPSEREKQLLREARRTKDNKGVELFVVGVGEDVEQELLHSLASHPAEDHVFRVANYSGLSALAPHVTSSLCPGSST